MPRDGDSVRRVLLVTHYFAEQGGGIERVAAQLARHLEADGQTRVVWAASDTRPLVESLACASQCVAMRAWDGVQRATGAPFPIWGPSALVKLWALVGEATLLHLHDCLYMGNVFAFVFAKLRGRPVVVTQHVSDVPFKSPLLKFALWLAYQTAGRLVLGRANQVVFISEEVRQDFSKRFSYRRAPLFIPNGVDATCFAPVNDEERELLRATLYGASCENVFLFVGRFVEKKGLSVLRRIATALPDSLFVMLGQGPVDPSAWGLENVRVVGAVDQKTLARYYQSADLLVLPSVGEGLPLVVQEAMSTGLPAAVSSRTARADSSVTNYLHHQPCTDELSEDDVVERWIGMLKQFPSESTFATRQALRRVAVDHWSWEGCAARYTEIFEELTC